MRDDHIIDMLDGARYSALGAEERTRAEGHASRCAPCLRALEASRLAEELLERRAEATVEPSPFFQTRVMAAIRERRAEAEAGSFARAWRAVAAQIYAMAFVVLLLAGGSYLTYDAGPAPDAPEVAAAQTLYSSDWDQFEDGQSSAVSDDQVLSMIYDSEDVYDQGP